MAITIAVDVSNTQVRALLLDPHEELTTLPTPLIQGKVARQWDLHGKRVSSDIVDKITELAEAVAGKNKPAVAGVGVALTGAVDKWGRVHPTNARVSQEEDLLIPLVGKLRERFGPQVDVAVGNRSEMAAWGEFKFGCGKEERADHLVFLSVGSGLGAGIVADRQLYVGAMGFAGQFGHMLVDPTSTERCKVCGEVGCLSVLAGGSALVRNLVSRKSDPAVTSLIEYVTKHQTPAHEDAGATNHTNSIGLDARAVVRAANEVDDSGNAAYPLAREIVLSTAVALGRASAQVAGLLDPGLIVLGGIVYDAEYLEDAIGNEAGCHLPPYRRKKTNLLRSRLRDEAPLYGAAAWVWDKPH